MQSTTESASTALAGAGADTVQAYEDAATAIGRLDAAGSLAEPGFRELLLARCVATATGTPHTGMIALARAAREGDAGESGESAFAAALRAGASRARGGVLPSVTSLHELLGIVPPSEPPAALDALLRDTHERTPPVLKAALAARALRALAAGAEASRTGAPGDEAGAQRLAALSVPLILCVGGATTDAWITLPPPPAPAGAPVDAAALRETFAALAREARSAERALAAARELCYADQARVRNALGRAAYSALDVLALLRRELVITIPETARTLGLTPPTAGAAVARLVKLGIAREITGMARLRAFAYSGLIGAFAPSAAR